MCTIPLNARGTRCACITCTIGTVNPKNFGVNKFSLCRIFLLSSAFSIFCNMCDTHVCTVHSVTVLYSMSKNMPGKTCLHKVLPLKERVKAVQLSRQGKSARQIALEIGIGTTQIENIHLKLTSFFLSYLIISSVQHCVLYLVLYVCRVQWT